ncbi:MAG: aminodeoxychorismate/anthranilate synthase component II [Alphaproteobacteria bacterium]|nr:aminodeoxychorismate/anthranilate synthase component II [Alphaproteobacteria bacterium SS10]
MRVLLIDNYDSFTYNLVQVMGTVGLESIVHRNDKISVADAMAIEAEAIVISPGPCDPDRAGICLDLIAAAADAKRPLLGVCLGHQALGQAFGGKVVRAGRPMHGKTSPISHNNDGIFAGLPNPFSVTRYHSLVVDSATSPNQLEITARSTDDDLIMGYQHAELPLYGVQFHPESIATEHGAQMLQNFKTMALQAQQKQAVPA